jgi:pSer/pThr/pTyr-binding forkhead associated (FHA) protein
MKVGCLTILEGVEKDKRFLLKNLSVFEAGRSQGNHIQLKDASVAMSHFRVYRSGQQYSIYDLGTNKGTLVNGQPVDKVDLKPCDRIQAGVVEMIFDLVDEDAPGRLASSAPDSSEKDGQALHGGIITKTRASTPTLIVIDGVDRGKQFPLLGKGQFKIGRGVTADLRLSDGKISRDHCLVETVSDHHIIVDLESANGTVVNGDRIKKTVLKEGDFIRLGYTMLRYDRV